MWLDRTSKEEEIGFSSRKDKDLCVCKVRKRGTRQDQMLLALGNRLFSLVVRLARKFCAHMRFAPSLSAVVLPFS